MGRRDGGSGEEGEGRVPRGGREPIWADIEISEERNSMGNIHFVFVHIFVESYVYTYLFVVFLFAFF